MYIPPFPYKNGFAAFHDTGLCDVTLAPSMKIKI